MAIAIPAEWRRRDLRHPQRLRSTPRQWPPPPAGVSPRRRRRARRVDRAPHAPDANPSREPSRGGPGGDPARTRAGPRHGRDDRSQSAREPALLQRLRRAGRPQPRRKTGTSRGLLRAVRTLFSFEPKLNRATGRRPVRGGRLPRPRRHGLGLPRPGPQRLRPWVVLKGLLNAGDRMPPRPRSPSGVPGRGRAPEHRQDLQLRPARRLPATSSWSTSAAQSLKQILAGRREANGGRARPAPADPGDRLHAGDPPRARLPARPRPALLRLQVGQRDPDREHSVKLIDLGGVYRSTSRAAHLRHGRLPGARDGHAGPSVSSDLFTVARTLAVLCIDFRGYQSTDRSRLPAADGAAVRRYDSLYRFLLKGRTRIPMIDSSRAEEMAEQLLGVLREVSATARAAVGTGAERSCSPPRSAPVPSGPTGASCPAPRSTATTRARDSWPRSRPRSNAQLIAQLREGAGAQPPRSSCGSAAALIDAGDLGEAEALLAEMRGRRPRGTGGSAGSAGSPALAAGRPAVARDRSTPSTGAARRARSQAGAGLVVRARRAAHGRAALVRRSSPGPTVDHEREVRPGSQPSRRRGPVWSDRGLRGVPGLLQRLPRRADGSDPEPESITTPPRPPAASDLLKAGTIAGAAADRRRAARSPDTGPARAPRCAELGRASVLADGSYCSEIGSRARVSRGPRARLPRAGQARGEPRRADPARRRGQPVRPRTWV